MKATNNNYGFLVEYITTKVVEWLMKDNGFGLEEAMVLFHNSETFDKLCDANTDMFIESPAYIYEILKDELRFGTLRGIVE